MSDSWRLPYPHLLSTWELGTWTPAEDKELLKWANDEVDMTWEFVARMVNRKKASGAKDKTVEECKDRCAELNADWGWAIAEEVFAHGAEELKKEKEAQKGWEEAKKGLEIAAGGIDAEQNGGSSREWKEEISRVAGKRSKAVFPGKAGKINLHDTTYYQSAKMSKKSSSSGKSGQVNHDYIEFPKQSGSTSKVSPKESLQGPTISKKSGSSKKPSPGYFLDSSGDCQPPGRGPASKLGEGSKRKR